MTLYGRDINSGINVGLHTRQNRKDKEEFVADIKRQIRCCTIEQNTEAMLLNERRVDGMIGLYGIEVFFQCSNQIINTFIAHSRSSCPFTVEITLI